MGWLDKVHEESEKAPHWLLQAVEHPKFHALHREETTWLIYVGEGAPLKGESLREVCQMFTEQFGLPT